MYHHLYSQPSSSGQQQDIREKQPYEAFLVLDVEATCREGTGFDWPNEIIEWPVCLMRWKDRSGEGNASQLEIVDEFRSFVKPTWRPQLSQYCMNLTGITQAQVDSAPTFPVVLKRFARFLAKHGLIGSENGRPIQRFCWCSDGPFDIRHFVVKQCFISRVPMPPWIRGDILDVRRSVSSWETDNKQETTAVEVPIYSFAVPLDITDSRRAGQLPEISRRQPLNMHLQLQALGLPEFQGRPHSGIDDARNLARIMAELARRGVRLIPNASIRPNRRWYWMGRPGEVREDLLQD
ncbi:hypothetical protein AZE42_03547 [Rhizopogon vesiculosus]|uniref:Exonuclease domain-containing protein n=1 Tax=Rhizopogon vesiculosus TaxID=180088 RepID=A0A1J8Q9W9_9AGAM|nr:hypothetical protein AZE42_03547 [Rhizopogon vesiculosus]